VVSCGGGESDIVGNMSAAREEILGPDLCSTPFDTVEEAITVMNDTVYGLAASVWPKNISTAFQVTRRVHA